MAWCWVAFQLCTVAFQLCTVVFQMARQQAAKREEQRQKLDAQMNLIYGTLDEDAQAELEEKRKEAALAPPVVETKASSTEEDTGMGRSAQQLFDEFDADSRSGVVERICSCCGPEGVVLTVASLVHVWM